MVQAAVPLGAAIALILVALFVRSTSNGRAAKTAFACLLTIGLAHLLAGALVYHYAPGPGAPMPDSEEEQSEYQRNARIESARSKNVVLGLAGIALVVALVAWPRRRSRGTTRGARLAGSITAVAVLAQAGVVLAEIQARIRNEDRWLALEEVKARAIAQCSNTPALQLGDTNPASLLARVEFDFHADFGVERVIVQRRRAYESFPFHCLVSANDAWCFAYGAGGTEPLEKLVREYPLSSLGDEALVEWVAFALGVYVADPTEAHAAPPRIERQSARVRIDFWERHPLIPGFGVELRHTQVVIDGHTLSVQRGPVTGPFYPPGAVEPL